MSQKPDVATLDFHYSFVEGRLEIITILLKEEEMFQTLPRN